MGTGVGIGDDRAIKAATEAISSPLLEDITIDGATGIIINITGNDSLTMHETNQAVTLIMEAADEDAEIIFGTVIDETLDDEIKVTVIATGLGGEDHLTTDKIQAKREQEILPEKVMEESSCFRVTIVEERKNLETFLQEEESKIAENSHNAAPLKREESSIISSPTSVYRKEAVERKQPIQIQEQKQLLKSSGLFLTMKKELDRPTYLRMTSESNDQGELR